MVADKPHFLPETSVVLESKTSIDVCTGLRSYLTKPIGLGGVRPGVMHSLARAFRRPDGPLHFTVHLERDHRLGATTIIGFGRMFFNDGKVGP